MNLLTRYLWKNPRWPSRGPLFRGPNGWPPLGGRPAPSMARMAAILHLRLPKGFEKFYPQKDQEAAKKEEGGGFHYQFEFNPRNWLMGLTLATSSFILYSTLNQPEALMADEISFQEFVNEYLYKKRVDRIEVVRNRDYAKIYYRTEDSDLAEAGDPFVVVNLGNVEMFETRVEKVQETMGPLRHDIPFFYVNAEEVKFVGDWVAQFCSGLFWVGLTLAPFLLIMRFMGSAGAGGMGGPGAGRSPFNMSKTSAKPVKSDVTFKDVAGLHQSKVEITEFVDFLKNPTKFTKLGAKLPRGGLLVGPPGTGKTLLAKAVAGEASVPFFSMSGSDFVEMFVGVGASRVRDLFEQAKQKAPSIVFIDEIDAIGRKRNKGGFGGGANDEREATLNQLLVEMDGFSSGANVVVLAGTNRYDVLDSALTRAGRFDRHIRLEKPDLSEREEIFQVYLRNLKLAPAEGGDNCASNMEVIATRLAKLTPGFVGADIRRLCNEAAIFAARRDSEIVDIQDFELASERIMGGVPKNKGFVSESQRSTVAIHEGGHVVAGWFLRYADPLLKTSIVARANGALGFAQYLPDEVSLYTKEMLFDKIRVTLGGRAAEELLTGTITTGASDDLKKITQIVYSMISVYGMDPDIGLLSYQKDDEDYQAVKPFSEMTAQKIDENAREIVSALYESTKELLASKKELVQKIAEALVENETLNVAQLEDILGKRGDFYECATKVPLLGEG